MDGGVTFWIYDDKGRLVTSMGADIKDDMAVAEWTYHYNGEKLDHKPKFTFEVTGNRCKKVESSACEIAQSISLLIGFDDGYLIEKIDGILLAKNCGEQIKISNGNYSNKDLIPDFWTFQLKSDELIKSKKCIKIEDSEIDTYIIQKLSAIKIIENAQSLPIEKKYCIIFETKRGFSC